MSRIAVILLAAGGSSRLGRPKQLLCIHGRSLVRRAADMALASGADTVYAVTGGAAPTVERALSGSAVTMVRNPLWRSGISTSIECGLRRACRDLPDLDAVIIQLVDQPMLTVEILNGLVQAFENGAGLVATEYKATKGAPALFSRAYFNALNELTGDHGAKSVLRRHATELATVVFPGGEIDIDTALDWEAVRSDSATAGPEVE